MAAGDSNFLVRYRGEVIPIEEITLADGSDTETVLHSGIDKTFGSEGAFDFGTATDDYIYATNQEITNGTSKTIAELTDCVAGDTIIFLFVKVTSTDNEGIDISFDGGTTYTANLKNVGEFLMIRPGNYRLDDSSFTAGDILFNIPTSGDSTTIDLFIVRDQV